MRLGALLLVLLIGACSPWHDIPDDLAYKGMEFGSGPLHKYNDKEIVDISLSTNFNFTNYIIKNSMLIVDNIYFCNQEHYNVQGLGGLGLYKKDNGWVSFFNEIKTMDSANPPYIYHIFIRTFSHDSHPIDQREKDITLLDFDLRQEPRDLCLRIYGNADYREQHSNVVRIPKEELIKLFATAPRALGN